MRVNSEALSVDIRGGSYVDAGRDKPERFEQEVAARTAAKPSRPTLRSLTKSNSFSQTSAAIVGAENLPDHHAVMSQAATAGLILNTRDVLQRQSDFSPHNQAVNDALTPFVHQMTAPYDRETVKAVLNHPMVDAARSALLSKLSQSEGEMEKFWATKILTEISVDRGALKNFLYFENYRELTDLEVEHWQSTNDQPKPDDHVAFVGSGALPLSAIMLHQKTGARVTCVDCDQQAVAQSRALIEKLGLSDKITVAEAKGEDADFSSNSHVIVAALIPDQAAVLRRVLQQAPGARLGVRSAEGMRQMLYPPTDEAAIKDLGVVSTGRSRTNRRVINTMLTFELDTQMKKRLSGHKLAANSEIKNLGVMA